MKETIEICEYVFKYTNTYVLTCVLFQEWKQGRRRNVKDEKEKRKRRLGRSRGWDHLHVVGISYMVTNANTTFTTMLPFGLPSSRDGLGPVLVSYRGASRRKAEPSSFLFSFQDPHLSILVFLFLFLAFSFRFSLARLLETSFSLLASPSRESEANRSSSLSSSVIIGHFRF